MKWGTEQSGSRRLIKFLTKMIDDDHAAAVDAGGAGGAVPVDAVEEGAEATFCRSAAAEAAASSLALRMRSLIFFTSSCCASYRFLPAAIVSSRRFWTWR